MAGVVAGAAERLLRGRWRHLSVVGGEAGEEAGGALGAAVARVEAAVAGLDGVDLDAVPDGAIDEAVVALQRVRTPLEAVSTVCVGCWDARRVWAADGSRSAGAGLARAAHTANRDAGVQVRRARRLVDMPRVAEAYGAGRITAAHVDRLAAVDLPRTPDAFVRDEAALVGMAEGLRWRDFERAVTDWRMHADPDGADADQQRVRTYVALVRVGESFSRAQVDHVLPHDAGGHTTEDNARVLCGPHNRARTTRPPPPR